ncbi:MFS transporter [Haloarchaeobius sp. TZWWS8]|uniref:MFS transporter n=1 Tax=Haloarchaeobius sp. TZWWS8 TaxID=3446121 RepID=UPI003EC0E397
MASLRGTVRRYYAYHCTNAYGFYLPVSVLYLLEVHGFGLAEIGAIKATFSFALVAAEIPTGYLGDRLGRRASLALGNALSALSLAAYVFLDSPVEYMLLNVVWATGWAFRSGTGDAWLYELLASHGEPGEFSRVRGRASTALLATSAVTALAAGFLATVDWAIPFFANAALATLGVPLLATLPRVDSSSVDEELDGREAPSEETFGVGDAVRTLRLQLGRPEVRWLVVFAALFAGLYGITRTFEQPAAAAVGVPLPAFGVLYACFKVVSATTATTTGWVHDRLGTSGVFLATMAVLASVYASALLVPVLVVPLLFVNRAGKTLLDPVRNQYLNDRLGDVGRATVLSGASMVLSVVSGAASLGGGWLAEALGPVQAIGVAGVGAMLAAGVLWVAVSPVREESSAGGRSEGIASGTD